MIYPIGWQVLRDAMHKSRYVHKRPEVKSLQDIRKELEGFFKHTLRTPLKTEMKAFQRKIMERRNAVAHPGYYGELREVDVTDAEEVLGLLVDINDFF